MIKTWRTGWALSGAATVLVAVSALPVAADEAEPTDAGGWLERIEQHADEVQTLHAQQVRYLRVRELQGDEQTRFGELKYDAGPPARFRVDFNRVVQDDQLREQERGFSFDGRWLAERQVDDEYRVFTRRELVPEEEVGRDLLRLGEGPFALPLDLERETVEERFAVELIDEPEPIEGLEDVRLVALRLTPLDHVEIDQDEIVLWYDRDTLLPVQTYLRDDRELTSSTITLHGIETGVTFDEGTFDTSPPDNERWQVRIVPLEQ